jgi:hypothetical protein
MLIAAAMAGVLNLVSTAAGREPAAIEPSAQELRPLAFKPLPLGHIKPAGWLKDQLRTQADGLSGHLDEFWPDIKNSAWTGGNAEGWERAPYWLDGIVPLAYELDDAALKAKAKAFIDYVLDHPQPDGWLGPVSDGKHEAYDPWPLFVLFKAFTQYQEVTGDPRIVPAMQKCLHKIDAVISEKPLSSWAHFRSADLALSLYWLYDRTHEAWLLDLADKVQRQGFDWGALYANFPFKAPTREKFDLSNHGVNTGMGLKQPGVRYRLSGKDSDRDAIDQMLAQLDRYHGQATGIFTCDEHLAGRSPSQGTELCTVVEAMFSLETGFSILGDPSLGDRLERITYNALPATFKSDMSAHQYDQQANQVICKLAPDRVYTNNGPDANIFGLEPNFGCCTANMHQGWPKFVSSLWLQAPDGGLVALAYAPCVVTTEFDGKPVRLEVQTEYPFRDTVKIVVDKQSDAPFLLRLRAPGWATNVVLRFGDGLNDGGRMVELAPRGFTPITIEKSGRSEITLRLPMSVRLWQGYNNSVAVLRGPLVYALPVASEWKRLKGNPPFADWEVYPTTPWSFALKIDREHPEKSIEFVTRPLAGPPFSAEAAPVLAHVEARALPQWTLEKNAAAPPPESPVKSDQPVVHRDLVPYGCTSLRVTELPTLADP